MEEVETKYRGKCNLKKELYHGMFFYYLCIVIFLFTLCRNFALANSDFSQRDYDLSTKHSPDIVVSWFSLGIKDSELNNAIGFRYNKYGFMLGIAKESNSINNNDIINAPVTDPNFVSDIGKYRNDKVGFDIVRFSDISSRTSLYYGIGLYKGKEDNIIRDDLTNKYHKKNSKDLYELSYNLGIHYYFDNGITIGSNLNNQRGIAMDIGWEF